MEGNFIRFEKMVIFYIFVNFSNVQPLYFLAVKPRYNEDPVVTNNI